MHTDPRDDVYDIIVVGSGLGGLSAAAFLAKFGQKVLVVERGDGPGGYAHAFQRGSYLFDPAIHVIAQAGEDETLDLLLRFLGVRDRCIFHRLPTLYRAAMPDLTLDAPVGLEGFIAAHTEQFPRQAANIRRFFEMCDQFFAEARQVTVQVAVRDLDRLIQQFPILFRYRTATLAEVLDEFFTDDRLKAICTASWPYMGLPPSKLSFELFARFLFTQMNGIHHCQHSFQTLVDAFVSAIEQRQGELVFSNQVERILMKDQRVSGVRLANQREIYAPVVISNADAISTFRNLVGHEYLPTAYARRLERLRPSLSMFVLYGATSLDVRQFNPTHETFMYKHWNHDHTYQEILSGRPSGGVLVVPTLADPSLAPAGEHLFTYAALAPYNIGQPWAEAKAQYIELILDECAEVFPGIRDQITFLEAATPLALERYTLNHQGAAYGWENTPAQSGSKRLTYETPIKGLYLAGHWAQAASALRVIISGTHTAQTILTHAGLQEVGPRF